jgi:hypothetical protein
MRFLIVLLVSLFPLTGFGQPAVDTFARKLCKEQSEIYTCTKINIPKNKKEPYYTWNEMFPNAKENHLLRNINRRNSLLRKGHFVARPRKMAEELTFSPMPFLTMTFTKHIVVDLNVLAWGAYENGVLVRWGAANGGSKICTDAPKGTRKQMCKTPVGVYPIHGKRGAVSRSKKYPLDCKDKSICGFPMRYMLLFDPKSGSGLHGAKYVHGGNRSHGCVRLFADDSAWLSKYFAVVGMDIVIKWY